MLTIGKVFTFDAAHRLGAHNGKCAHPHGHTYSLEVELGGVRQPAGYPDQGMILDYYLLKQIVQEEILERFDHRDLNVEMRPFFPGLDPEEANVTTAENMVVVFAQLLGERLASSSPQVTLTRVRLQETPNTFAEWRPDTEMP